MLTQLNESHEISKAFLQNSMLSSYPGGEMKWCIASSADMLQRITEEVMIGSRGVANFRCHTLWSIQTNDSDVIIL